MKHFKLYLWLFIITTISTSYLYIKNSKRVVAPNSFLKHVIEEDLEKSGNTKLDLYVMSFCPFGVNAEKTIIPILQEMGDRIDFNIFFIVNEKEDKTFTSLHGEPEVLEDRRQLVIARHFPAQFLDYLSKRSLDYAKADWSVSALAVGLDVKCINELINQQEEIEAFRKNIANSNSKKIFASPTLFINGKPYSGSFSIEPSTASGQCEGGVNAGQPCDFFTDCPHACVGGFRNGQDCRVTTDCPGICEGGFDDGSSCVNPLTCRKACVGGSMNGQMCTGETCRGICVGGTNAGNGCLLGVECPGGTCSLGTCTDIGTCNLNADCTNKGECIFTFYLDADGDGYYSQTMRAAHSPGTGWTTSEGSGGGDCNDNDATIHPGAEDPPCGPPDRNCDGQTNACPAVNFKINAECTNGHIMVNWETDAAISAYNFVIERSTDGMKWQQVSTINVPGISEAGKKYSFLDTKSDVNSNFYRIISNAPNGNKRYSQLVGSPCPSIQNLTVNPNPVNHIATVSIPSLTNTVMRLSLYDSKGTVVEARDVNLHIGKNQFQFDLVKLPSGVYTVIGRSGNFSKNVKIIKN